VVLLIVGLGIYLKLTAHIENIEEA